MRYGRKIYILKVIRRNITAFTVNKIPCISKYAPLPSRPMIIRRYRPLTKKKYIQTYFTQGLFCHRLTEFDDDNDGLLENMIDDPAVKAALAASSRRDADVASDEEFRKAFEKYHEDARFQHYANCWRLGVDEKEKIWKRYTEEDMVEGCAIETTVGRLLSILPKKPTDPSYETGKPHEEGSDFHGIYKTPPEGVSIEGVGNDIRVGACRYQQRINSNSGQPQGIRRAIPFFKGEKFDIENEFRLLLNPYSSNVPINKNNDGTPTTFRPDSDKFSIDYDALLGLPIDYDEFLRFPIFKYKFLKFPIDMKLISNAIILAPNAEAEQRKKINKWLREFYGSATKRSKQIDILQSSLSGGRREQSHNYICELGGLDNYTKSFGEITDAANDYLEKRNWNTWPLVDIVIIHTDKSGFIVEGYWHRTDDPVLKLDDYGYDFQSIVAMRYNSPDTQIDARMNENAEQSDRIPIEWE